MKKLLFILLFLTVNFTLLFSQNITTDTTSAAENYKKGKDCYNIMLFDSAFTFFQNASDIYKEYKLWNKYLYAESEKASCKSLNFDSDEAFKIINNAFKKTENLVKQNSSAYAFALFHKGKIFHNMNLPDSALGYYEQALKIRENIYKTDNRELADSYYYLNKIYFSFYDLEKAMYYNTKALKIAEKLYEEDNSLIINILNDKGLIELYSMKHREAEKIFEHTLKLTQNKFGSDNFENIYALSYLGLVYQDLGDYDKAIENQKEVLRLSINNLGSEHYYCGTAYQNLANAYNHKMQNDIAIDYAKKAISIFTNVFGEKSEDVADAIGNLGVIYSDIKDVDNGLIYLNESLKIFKEIKGEDSYDVSRIYQSIAAMYQDAGDYKKAEHYNSISLELKKKNIKDDHYSLAQLYSNMGILETLMKNYDKALEFFKKAEPIFIKNYGFKSVNMAILYNNMGDNYKFAGNIENSIKCYQKALVLNHKTFKDTFNIFNFPKSEGFYSWHDLLIPILAKAEIFLIFPERFNTISVKKCFEISLNHYKVCDTIISRIKLSTCSKEDKIFIASKSINIYKGIVETCMKLVDLSVNEQEKRKYSDLAFLYSEKNKTSVLLEALAGAEAQKFAGIPDSLLKIEKNLQIDISYYKKLIAESPDSIEEIDYFNKLFKLNRDYDTLIFVLEKQYPKYHDLKYSGYKIHISDLQKSLDKKTVLISYFLTDSFTIIYFISNKKFYVEKVPKNENLIKQVFNFRENISNADFLQDAYSSNDNRIVKEYIKDAYELYDQLFPDKIRKLLKGSLFSKIKNLIIIPDGQLSTMPFEALHSQKYTTSWTDWENTDYFSEMPYLVKDYNISYSYSGNLFYKTNPKTTDKPEFQNISDWLALAPVFDNDSISGTNLRTRKLIEKNSTDQSGNLNTRAWLRDGSYITPLPGSEEETKEIFNIFESNNKKAILKTHKFANEEFVKSGVLKDFKYLHIATHGMVNEDKPELSCILLAQDTTSTEDNILFSGEIYNLELNADLTVLSACETGLGKIAEGEGVIGLTRALLYAGSKNIIVSLWQVSDESTNQLMVDFYSNFLNKKTPPLKGAGGMFAEHLSKSKLKLIKEGKYAHPFFWSPFVLIGK
ncbi:MAG: CHAT domain-containing protein [Bacteroidales bacterium]|nr:CHAT domain-containing protein [Bacteroidales bacterium]